MDNRGLPIPIEIQALVALRFYGTGSFQTVCGDLNYISQPTVSKIVAQVSKELSKHLTRFVNYQRQRIPAIKEGFRNLGASRSLSGLPNIIGAIDCTHIQINRPRGFDHSEVYRNRHGWFSINVQVVVGPDMMIHDIVARWPGSSHDSRIFRNSRIHSKLISGDLDGVLVGDGGYACSAIMLTPFRTPSTQGEQNYNDVQIRTRNVVERTFGVLKRRFPCLKKGLAYKLTTSCNIIIAAAILHNIALLHESQYHYENFDQYDGRHSQCAQQNEVQANRNTAEGVALRNVLVSNLYSN